MIFFFCGFCFLYPKTSNPDHKDFHLYDFWLNLYALSLLSFAFIHAVTMMTSHGVSLMETCARFLN